MNKHIIPLGIIIIFLLMLIPTTQGYKDFNEEPELETYIYSGFHVFSFKIHISNIGTATAHNVKITDVTTDGSIYFNFQPAKMQAYTINPGMSTALETRSMAFGMGNFSVSMTVSCDEGMSSTSSVIGVIIGPFILIP